MSVLLNAAAFAQDPQLRPVLEAAVVAQAVVVVAEGAGVQNHAARLVYALRTLHNPSGDLDSWAWATSTQTSMVTQWVGGDHEGATSGLSAWVATGWNTMST